MLASAIIVSTSKFKSYNCITYIYHIEPFKSRWPFHRKKIDNYRRSCFEEMMPKNEEGVLRRLESLRRRSAALKGAVRQLVVEIEEERKNCGDVQSGKKDVLRARLRRLFDADVRLRNLARNYERKKSLQRNVLKDETSDEAGLAEMEICGDDSEFDPSKVVVGQHQPPMFPVLPLPHRFSFQTSSYSHPPSSAQQGSAANCLDSGMADASPASPSH